jgi:hypothetical protein
MRAKADIDTSRNRFAEAIVLQTRLVRGRLSLGGMASIAD